MIQENWGHNLHSNLLINIWFKLKALKKELKELNAKYFQGIPKRIEDAQNVLDATQKLLASDPLNLKLIEGEKVCLASLEKLSTIEENIWLQKFRANWIQLGDSNTKFFHAYTKERKGQNHIKYLISADGNKIQNHHQIKEEVRDFYLQLMGSAATSLPMVDQKCSPARTYISKSSSRPSLFRYHNT